MSPKTMLPFLLMTLLLCNSQLAHAQASSSNSQEPSPVVTTTTIPTPTVSPTPEATMTRGEALEQAQNQLPEPPPVYDLTNPGIVYGRLNEGVQAWIASLGQNCDRFGNAVTDSYVTAVRPDVVPASLQAFLLQYYKDDPSVGLAFGPGGVKAATLYTQSDYNDKVNELANQLFDQSIEASEDSEDIPPLDENDQDGSSDDSNEDEDGEDDGNDGSDDNPSADGPATISSIEEDFGIDVQKGDKEFTEDELAALRTGLSYLPSDWYAPASLNPPESQDPTPCRIQRHSTVTHNGQQAFGLFSPSEPSHIEVSDAAWELYDYDFSNPPFNKESGREAQFGGTIVHEMTHRFLSTDSEGRYIADMADKPAVAQWAQDFAWQVTGDGGWSCSDKDSCVTEYAGSVNPEEDMAESVMMYVFWPNKLRHVSQEKYDFVKNVLGIAETGRSEPYPPE